MSSEDGSGEYRLPIADFQNGKTNWQLAINLRSLPVWFWLILGAGCASHISSELEARENPTSTQQF